MVLSIISYILGFLSGVILIALLNGNKHDEIEAELQEMYLLGQREGLEQGKRIERIARMTAEKTDKMR